ncbi:MAG: CPBP family intramembrane glutamate endopeptidase, partial [Staphylococcus lugdunensis]|nr:CPBP family intramembrane glutamate endopeptidase [Staphylococcus lugdunensis]
TYLKTKSVFMPAVLHGIFNQFSTTVYMFALKRSEFNSLIYGPTGVIGIIVLSIFALILILKIDNIDRKS